KRGGGGQGWKGGKWRPVGWAPVPPRRPFRCGRTAALTEWNTSTGPRNDSTVTPRPVRASIGTKKVNRRCDTERTSTRRMVGDATFGGGTLAHGLNAFRKSSE